MLSHDVIPDQAGKVYLTTVGFKPATSGLTALNALPTKLHCQVNTTMLYFIT